MQVAREGGDHKTKKFEKDRKKFLTNERFCDKITKLCDERQPPGAQRTAQKNLKKLVKKYLTNSTRCAKLIKSLRRARQRLYLVN